MYPFMDYKLDYVQISVSEGEYREFSHPLDSKALQRVRISSSCLLPPEIQIFRKNGHFDQSPDFSFFFSFFFISPT